VLDDLRGGGHELGKEFMGRETSVDEGFAELAGFLAEKCGAGWWCHFGDGLLISIEFWIT